MRSMEGKEQNLMKNILDHGLDSTSTLWELIIAGLRFLNYLVQGKQACLYFFGLSLIILTYEFY